MAVNRKAVQEYTEIILSFQLGNEKCSPLKKCNIKQHLDRSLRKLQSASDTATIILLGAGSGTFFSQLAAKTTRDILVVESEIANARKFITANREAALLADSSTQGLFLQILQNATGEHSIIRNPECDLSGKNHPLRNLEHLLLQSKTSNLPQNSLTPPSLTAGAILHPEEPDLEQFAQQFPAWVTKLIIVWDAEHLPEKRKLIDKHSHISVEHIASPLHKDFSAQRNKMINDIQTEWFIYLDGDERLADSDWSKIRHIAAPETKEKISGYYFPRQTYIGTEKTCRMGYGLWPDLQLRLFRPSGTTFVNPVHEQLTGLQGSTAVLSRCVIHHYSHITKDEAVIARKLDVFSEAADNKIKHTLNKEFPTLATEKFKYNNIPEIIILPTSS